MRFPGLVFVGFAGAIAAIWAPPSKSAPLKGNAACWGDDARQDISCQALTERFLLGMGGATKDEVIKAMGVHGRIDQDDRLHFVSNYARGERGATGDVNFTFKDGQVAIISAFIDTTSGEPREFLWNADLQPVACFDGSPTLQPCN